MTEDRYNTGVPQGTTDIICNQCGTKPRLKSLDKNNGTGVECDCDGAKYHMDSVPYELTVGDLPEPWVRERDQDKHAAPEALGFVEVDKTADREQ